MRRQPRAPSAAFAPFRDTRHAPHLVLAAVLLALTAAPLPARAALPIVVSAQIYAFPADVAPGGQLQVGGYGFPASSEIGLELACRDGTFDLGSTPADANGRVRTSVTVSAAEPGTCALDARTGRTVLASTDILILPAVQLDLSSDTAPPGTHVNFTAANLVAGQLRLDYAGAPVFGPVPVGPGSFMGEFVVPGDRPEPLGEIAVIRVSNSVLGTVTGAAETLFMSQPASDPPIYRVSELRLPDASIPAGGEFILAGRLSPAPVGPLDDFRIIPMWRKADGRTLPIGRGPAQLSADGSFSAPARVPGLIAGDPTWPESGDQIGVTVFAPDTAGSTFMEPATDPWAITPFNVIVVDAQTKQLIPGAKVSFQVWDMTISAGSLDQVAAQVFAGPVNQVTQVLTGPELTEDEKVQIALEKAMCIPQAIPVGQTKWELYNHTLDEALSQPTLAGQYQTGTIITSQAAGTAVRQGSVASPAAAGVINYLLTVDAIDAGGSGQPGWALKDPDGAIKTYSLRVDYHWADHSYRKTDGTLLPNPFTVELARLSSGDVSALGPIKVFMAGIGAPVQPQPASLPRFGVYYSTKAVPANVVTTKLGDGYVLVTLSTEQQHKLAIGQPMRLYIDGVQVATAPLDFKSGLTCSKFKGVTGSSPPYYEARLVIPNAHLLSAGIHSLDVQGQLLNGQWVTYQHQLKMVSPPASWFATPAKGSRTLNWSPAKVTLVSKWLDATDSQLLTSGAETDETGPLDNRTKPNVTFTQSAEANEHKGGQTSGSLAGQAINRDGKGCLLTNCPPNAPLPPGWSSAAASPSAPQANVVHSYTYGPHKEDVVPEVKYNIPGFVAGIPFVAAVEAGGVLKYAAWVTYGGEITAYDDGSIRARARVYPAATVGAGMYISGYILGGLVAAGKVELTANMDLGMPITYDTKAGLSKGGMCFEYHADLVTWSGYACIPFTEICAYSDSDTEVLFNDEEPDGCAVPSQAAATLPAAVPPPSPSIGHLDLASNGYGKVMAVWQETRTSLATSVFDGKTWTPAGSIATGVGATQPQVAFLTPHSAVAVWTETNLAEPQLPNQSSTTLIKAQRIAFATWNGITWSAAQPLTQPGLGEGGPALAACPEWQAGCPAGGAAVAVWERNLSADFDARQIRLFTSTFQGAVWGAIQPLDAASTSTDILPSAAYLDGVPLVAWVRDSDTDLTELSSRRISLRFLDGAEVFTPAELPSGIAEVALTVDGNGSPVLAFTRFEEASQLFSNQRPLWAATVACTAPNVCTWQPQELHDAAGRTLYAERPLLSLAGAQQVEVTFRGLGFGGGLSAQPTDPPGMTAGAGELAHGVIDLATGHLTPKYLTQDGAVNWLPSQAYDPLLDTVLATAVKGSVITGLSSSAAAARTEATAAVTAPEATVFASPAPELPLLMAAEPNQVDFVLADAVLAGGAASGEPLQLTVRVENHGAVWTPLLDAPLLVSATWDGGPGNGVSAGSALVGALAPGSFAETTFVLTPPAAGLDVLHTLHVVANPGLVIPEASAANNRRVLETGGISAPHALWAEVKPGSRLVFLGWDAVADRRVAGYRIYRTDSRGVWEPIGASFAPGYVDLNTVEDQLVGYAITAYTAEGIESPRSASVQARAPAELPMGRTYLPAVFRSLGPR